ncbi:acyl-CoA dehydrogenase family protein [Chelatococcus daeguensis]|uniref:acyl-CoA dehydrogenase family protein n=1 Tax=Chelatococcus daeguensis TaxID=444444 RepID=UPI000AA214D3|nr:acyl-CoA dehydrogenase family protein [Chelatococcus daeguensis]
MNAPAMTAEDAAALVEAVADFSRSVLAPAAAEIDRTGRSATMHLPQLAQMGIMGLNLPEACGGIGLPATALFEAVAAIAGACGSTASMVTAHWLATDSILIGGTPEQQQRYLPAAAAGQALGAFGLTEPGAGSNPADMTTRAVREGDGYRITGTKHFISNAGEADFIVVYAKTDMAAGARGISAFVVEPKAGGVRCSAPEPTMGLRGGHVFEVSLDCVVPAENRLGEESKGFRTALKVLDAGRLEIAACAVGIAQAALAAALDWARERKVGGEPIAHFQGLQWMLADMATDIAAARQLGLAAARKREAGERFSMEASMAKLHASEMVGRVTDKALQIHGGYGFTTALPLERYMRDCRIFRIYEGSSEIQRNIIARHLLG